MRRLRVVPFWSVVAPAMLGAAVAGVFLFESGSIRARIRGADLHLELASDPPSTVRGGDKVRLRLRVHNFSGQAVALYDVVKKQSCDSIDFEGLPTVAAPHATAEVVARISTAGLNGPQSFEVPIGTSSAVNPRLSAEVPLVVLADEVRRARTVGLWRAGGDVRDERIVVDNLPADGLLRVGGVTQPGWKVSVVKASGRSVELSLTGRVPPAALPKGTFQLGFDLYFRSPELRRAEVVVAAGFVNEWVLLSAIALNPMVESAANPTLLIEHRPRGRSEDHSAVEVCASPSGGKCEVAPVVDEGPFGGWPRKRFRIPVPAGSFRATSLTLRLTGDEGVSTVTVPVLVMGSPGRP